MSAEIGRVLWMMVAVGSATACDLPLAIVDIDASRIVYHQYDDTLDVSIFDDGDDEGCLRLDSSTTEFLLNGEILVSGGNAFSGDGVHYGGKAPYLGGATTPVCYPYAFVRDLRERELGDKATFEARDESGSIEVVVVGIAEELLSIADASVMRGESLVISGESEAPVDGSETFVVVGDQEFTWPVSRLGTDVELDVPADAILGAARFSASSMLRDVEVKCAAATCEVEVASWTTPPDSTVDGLEFEIVE